MPRSYVWGVDSASPVQESLWHCVTSQFGKPRFWGRYLSTVPRAATGLTPKEISFLHRHGVKILPIYNEHREAIGAEHGIQAARQAIRHAQQLGVPKGTFLFANIEHFFAVDAAWILAWFHTLRNSRYAAGFYHDPVRGGFRRAYCEAVRHDHRLAVESVLWSAQLEMHVTGPEQAPVFHPSKPPCPANVWLWQYGRDAKSCPVDTNLMDSRLLYRLF